ncbi:MAG: L,D-transpeptidase [Myxococcota bacterium]|nr:L,D-transpeptidase [Myxococcota bacterium]
MPRRKNKKRKPKRKKKGALLVKLKTFFISSVLGMVAALGLWRCWDDEADPEKKVDVGKDRTPDPTLVNEHRLLKEEMPREAPLPEVTIKPEDVQAGKKEASPLVTEEAQEKEALAPRFPMYAVAFHFHTQIRNAPSSDARVIGYARRGATFRVSQRVSKRNCKKGWHEIDPGGLFICNGQGVIISDQPVTFAPSPPPPNPDEPLPYDYAYITQDNIPQYWRVPTADETAAVAELLEEIAARDAGADPPEATATDTDDGGVSDPYALPPFVHQRMKRGYYVSVDNRVYDEQHAYAQTVRGRYIPADKLGPAKPSTYEGLLVNGTMTLPRVFVVGGGVRMLRRDTPDGPLTSDKKIERFLNLPFYEEIIRRNRRYIRVGENLFVSSRVAAALQVSAPPFDVQPDERWIDIDLSEQTLVAYEGVRPVFATLISSGKPGFETPEGTFRIYAKHISITMDDPDAGEEAYSIEDVPWTQYFKDSFALHAAFWHNRFGRVRSHGCVNLSPRDARRLFSWTGPAIPSGLHGIIATPENPGTRVVVHN